MLETPPLYLLESYLSCFFARYDPRHNKWLQIQPLQQEHADLCVCMVDGAIYAVAGRNYREDLREVEKYDPKTNSWEYVAPLQREVRRERQAGLWPEVAPGDECHA